MSIPTSNLYDFIHQVTESKYHLFYFYPYGKKDLRDVIFYTIHQGDPSVKNIVPNFKLIKKYFPASYLDKNINFLKYTPILFAHDQEPLNFDLYADNNISADVIQKTHSALLKKVENYNLKNVRPDNFLKKWILLHSEHNSDQVKRYENTDEYVGAYWWSHALMSLDWFRFAEVDKKLTKTFNFKKPYLVYARELVGTRSYRKRFLEQLETNDLLDYCQTKSFHKITDTPDLSADYNSYDIVNTAFSVILETIFDQRIHLTEKTCRALSTGHPFLLANGPGSLKYIRSYGFKTFHPYINESYDEEINDSKRLEMIVEEMKRLNSLDTQKWDKIVYECYKIAEYNKKLFFSEQFYQSIVAELKNNIEAAFHQVAYELNPKTIWYDHNFTKQTMPEVFFSEKNKKKRFFTLNLLLHLRKGGTLENYVPPDLD